MRFGPAMRQLLLEDLVHPGQDPPDVAGRVADAASREQRLVGRRADRRPWPGPLEPQSAEDAGRPGSPTDAVVEASPER
jgi:hypothetical protein